MRRAGLSEGKPRSILSELKLQGVVLLGIVAVFWIVELLDLVVFGGALDSGGIRPRTVSGLWGILFAPFLHGGLGHVAANSLAFMVLGWLIMLRETWHFFAVTLMTMVLGGLGVWLVGPASSVHIGASGLVFGYFGFLLLSGWFDRSLGTVIISLFVLLAYGGMIWGVLPGQLGISWQGHLFGFLAGVLSAKLLARRRSAA